MGGTTEFARFVEEQLPRLRSYVARMPGAKDAGIEDLLQEALLRAYEARDRFESDQHAVNWICQVVRNLLADRRRSWSRRPVLLQADLDDLGDCVPDPADLVVSAEQANLAVHALTRLSQAQRDLLWEHVVDGVSYAEIARRTATPLATVRSLAHRARVAAVREFAHAGGALSALPALALRPWRRLAHRFIGIPPGAVDAMAAAGAVIVAFAMPAAVTSGALTFAVPVAAPATTAPAIGVATVDRLVAPHPAADAPTRDRTASPATSPGVPDPNGVVQSVQTGGFSGTYSSACTFENDTGVRVLDSYDCRFSAISDFCRIKLRGSTTATTGCRLELLGAEVAGGAVGVEGFGIRGRVWHCGHGGSGSGTVRFRASEGARPVNIHVSLFMNDTDVSIVSNDVKTLGLSASFPFSCTMPHQTDQIGFQGTLGS